MRIVPQHILRIKLVNLMAVALRMGTPTKVQASSELRYGVSRIACEQENKLLIKIILIT